MRFTALAFCLMVSVSACSSYPVKVQPESGSSKPTVAKSPSFTPLQSPAAWVAAAIAGDGPGNRAPAGSPEPVAVSNLPKSERGNPAVYTVGGQKYAVMDSAAGFEETGLASWYGRKFHGRETSSGEVYDMYQMTAAHKHLPLPTFVRVTRTDNGASIIVKVNDRGPFVPGRVIDLSYQAASALGVLKNGTVSVHLQALSTHSPKPTADLIASKPQSQQLRQSQQSQRS